MSGNKEKVDSEKRFVSEFKVNQVSFEPENYDLHSFPAKRFKMYSITWKAYCLKISKTCLKIESYQWPECITK